MEEKDIVWITKYALTQGIYTMEVKRYSPNGRVVYGEWLFEEYHGKDWYKTKEEAIKRAEELRDAKIKVLESQLKKLKSLTFK